MLYLITGELVEGGPGVPPQQAAAVFEQVVIPSVEALAKLEREKKITGGVYVGQRSGTFIIDAPSHEAAGQLLASLPFWGILKWEVYPLTSFQAALERDRKVLEGIKAMLPK